MAVPFSGTLTMLGLAQEALYGTYGSGTITSPIHMYDLVNGGNSAGSGNSYPAVNQNCLPNPADRTAAVLTDVYYVEASDPVDLFYSASIGVASNLSVGDVLYINQALTILATVGLTTVYQTGTSATTTRAENGCFCEITMNASAAITVLLVECP